MNNTLESIKETIISVLAEMIKDWNIEGLTITGPTLLAGDLGLSSLDALQVMANLDIKLGTRLPYDRLVMRDGEYMQDLSVDQLAEFALQFVAQEPTDAAKF